MDRSKTIRQTIFVVIILSAVTVAAYWGVLDHQFINYDEPDYVTDNPHVVTGLTLANVTWAFGAGYAGNWHPLTWVSHMLDCQLYGLKPFGHHLTNLLLHAANTVLLFLFLRRTTGAPWCSTFGAALFALHPLHVESVAWVAERKDVLSTFFGLVSLLAYARFAQDTSSRPAPPASAAEKSQVQKSGPWTVYYFLALLFLALGLMSKPMLVTMPLLLLLLDYWPLRRMVSLGKLVAEKIPFFLLVVGSSIVTFIVQQKAGAVSSLEALSPEFRVSNALISYVRYIWKMIWPENLAVFYPVPSPAAWPLELVLGASLLLALISVGSVKWARKAPYFFVGWWWYVISLLPVIGLIQVGQQAMADRYSYIPLIGLFVAMVWGIAALQARLSLTAGWVAAAGAALLTACGLLTWRQSAYWSTTTTLFEHAIAATGDNAVAQNNLGVSLQDAGDWAGAESHFAEAVRIKPRYADALENLGLCREKQGRRAEAIEFLQKALEIKPGPVTCYNAAKMFGEEGDWPRAVEHYRRALELKPDFVKARYNLAVLLAKQGRGDEAASEYEEVLRLAPDFPEAHASFGALLAAQGKLDQAIAQFNAALKASPDSADAQYNLAAALKAKGDFEAAASHYAETCRLRPDDIEAREDLGFTLLLAGHATEAVPQFEQVIQTRPNARAHYYMGLALDGLGKGAEAMAHYRVAVRLEPNAPLYLNDLAWALATNPDSSLRNGAEAVDLAQRACQLSGGKEAQFWGTLDAAYAEAGRFDEALATAKKTRAIALAAGQQDIARRAEERLALYQSGKPYRPPETAVGNH